MTRFEQEISGNLGAFWKKNAKEEVKRAVEMATTEATVEEDGAIRWNRSGNYIPDDFCEKLEYAGFTFSREATRAAREAQDAESLAAYRKNHKGFTAEEIAEARAAFGKGETIVNILTGEKITL